MLDSEAPIDVEVVTPELPEEEAAAEPEELVVTIEGEEPEPDEDAEVEAELGDKGRNALRAAREAAKKARAEARELAAKLAEREQPQQQPELKRPTLEECGFNEDTFAEKLAEYVAAKKEADAKKAEAEQAEKARVEAYNAKLSKYMEDRAKVGVDDDAQARVVAALTAQQQMALMDAAQDPAKVVAALAKHPKALAELAGIKEIHRFTYQLARVEDRIKMASKTPPAPESKLRPTPGAPVNNTALEKLRQQAESSGDWTQYFAEKRRREGKG